MRDKPSLHALALVCSLKASPEPSSSEKLAREVLAALEEQGRVARGRAGDRPRREARRPGRHGRGRRVAGDPGEAAGRRHPGLRHPDLGRPLTSVAQGVLERLDGELSETDESGRPLIGGKVAVVAVVGNEDGAHHISADAFQALADVGFTIPAQGVTYWNGEAMSGTDYLDLEQSPEPVAQATKTLAENAAHLAWLLKADPYS